MHDGMLRVILQDGFTAALGSIFELMPFSPGELTGVTANIRNHYFNNANGWWFVVYNNAGVYVELETHPESPPATMGSSCGGPNGGLEDQQKVEKSS